MEMFRFTDSVLAAQQNDEKAFEFLYNKSFVILKREALKYVKNEFDADDVLQNTYMSIFRNISSLKEPEKFIPWSLSICRNFCINECVRKAKQNERNEFRPIISEEEQEGMDTLSADSYVLSASPDAVVDAAETKRLLSEIIDTLPEMQRTCILLWQEEFPTKEIAKMVQIPEGTVKSNVSYAKKKIKAQVLNLEKQGTKLYGLAPIPFFLWILRQFESAYEPELIANGATGSFSAIIKSFRAYSVSEAGVSASTAGIDLKTAASGAVKGGAGILTKSVVITIVSALTVGGIIGGIVVHNARMGSAALESERMEEPVSEEEELQRDPDITNEPEIQEPEIYDAGVYSFVMPTEWQKKDIQVEVEGNDMRFTWHGLELAHIYTVFGIDLENFHKNSDTAYTEGDTAYWDVALIAEASEHPLGIRVTAPSYTKRIPWVESGKLSDDEAASTIKALLEDEKQELIALTSTGECTLEECREAAGDNQYGTNNSAPNNAFITFFQDTIIPCIHLYAEVSPTNDIITSADSEEIYATLLNDYNRFFSGETPWQDTYLSSVDNFPLWFDWGMIADENGFYIGDDSSIYYNHPDATGVQVEYAFFDLNGDGIDEVLFNNATGYSDYVSHIWTVDEQGNIIFVQASQYRNILFILNDGGILYEGDWGVATGMREIYDLDSNGTLIEREILDWDRNPENSELPPVYEYNGMSISETDAQTLIEQWEGQIKTDLVWHSIDDYKKSRDEKYTKE